MGYAPRKCATCNGTGLSLPPVACMSGAASAARQVFTRCQGDEIRALRRLQREKGPSSYVFVSEPGGSIAPKSFGTLFTRLGERAGMAFPIHPHMLRHGCGYALANAGFLSRRRISRSELWRQVTEDENS